MASARSIIKDVDPIWEKKYSQGHGEKYPWDCVVSFVFKYAPQYRSRNEVKLLEIGFGSGCNLWFAAREGIAVSGIEASKTAVINARKWFADEKLAGDLRQGNFRELPFADEQFDLVIDRDSLCCVGVEDLRRAIGEIYRVLRPGGKFFYNTYADSHSSLRSGECGADGLIMNIDAGRLVGCGQLHFVSRTELNTQFADGWKFISIDRVEITDMLAPCGDTHAEWRVVVEKVEITNS